MTEEQIEQCQKRIKTLSHYLARKNPDLEEDVASVLWLEFVKASRTYIPGRECGLATYAQDHAIKVAKRYLDSERRRGIKVPENRRWDTPLPRVGTITYDLPQEETANEREPGFWRRVRGLLDEDDWMVVKLRFKDGHKVAAIGTKLGKSKEYCRFVLSRVLPMLRRRAPDLMWL